MKWVRFSHQGTPGFGTLIGEQIHLFTGDMFNAPQATGHVLGLDSVQLEPPCVPQKIFALWNNFAAAAAKNNWAKPTEPLYFLKANNTLNRHLAIIQRPRSFEGRLLYEAELGVVIGKRGRNISVDDAAAHVFGYTCVNDITALDILRADASFEQWTRAKGFDGFAPIGPCIETELDLVNTNVRALLNGRERQNYSIGDMFFSPLALVSLLSRDVTLEPGDIISCGTSLGAGPWVDGATLEVCIDGLGMLSNTMQAKDASTTKDPSNF